MRAEVAGGEAVDGELVGETPADRLVVIGGFLHDAPT
jgi:hypothetical protein